ncbi:MAG TPA: hypothetical protein VHW23_28915 [Kofleriaceae bacterium]|jgi:hypothetical protein|nr:hypothetical protein [Kofleriaceae bacterium]
MATRTDAQHVADLATLARLHAALDSVVETEQVIAAIHDSSASRAAAVARIGALLGEARELLRVMLRPDRRHAGVGPLDSLAAGRAGS